MAAPCYITGTGLVSAQGVGVSENWQNLLAGRVLHDTGVVPIARDQAVSRASQLAIRAACEALESAGKPTLSDGRTALVIGTSKGPIEDWIEQLNGDRPPDLTLGLAQIATDVAAAFGHTGGARLTLAGACASGLHALVRAFDLIRTGECDHALVVATEASTHALFKANFARLGVLADPAEGCRPFDERRRGFLLGEAAAAVWLTRRPSPRAIRIDAGLALADATHLTGIDRDGRSLRHLLERLATPEIDLVHSHGTGTLLNDAVEFTAIAATSSRSSPVVYSHKHAIGHTQGAAGLIGVVLNAEMHRRGVVLGNSNSDRKMSSNEQGLIRFDHMSIEATICHSLVVAAGFGGTLAGVRLNSQNAAKSGLKA